MGRDELLAFAAQGKHARDLQNVRGRFGYLGASAFASLSSGWAGAFCLSPS